MLLNQKVNNCMKIVINEPFDIDQMVAKEITKLVNNNPNTVLGLATGATMLGVYKNLADDHKENKTDYTHVITFNLDEYVGLDADHEQSYRYYMKENLFKHININPKNINFPGQDAPQAYTELIKQHNIDLILLGVGRDGHIAFNEPYTSFDSETSIVDLWASTINDNKRFFKDDEDVPTKAITMGFKEIMSAKRVILIAYGINKAQAIKQLINGKEDEAWPLTILKRHPYVTVYLDEDAASLLE